MSPYLLKIVYIKMECRIKMGCTMSLFRKNHTEMMIQSLEHLREIDGLLEQMYAKYQRQIADIDMEVKSGLKRGVSKKMLLNKLRKKKIILHYMNQTSAKRDQIISKTYALENLNITAMQLNAMKSTAVAFRSFSSSHNVEKIEQLQDTMDEYQDQFMEIDEIISKDISLDFDDDALEAELEELKNSPEEVIVSTFPTLPQIEEEVVTQERVPLLIQ